MSAGRPREEHLGIPRLSWESDHEWRCRTIFLDTNQTFYSGDRLAAYSMAWANWKFMGNHYGEEVQNILSTCHSRLPEDVDKEIRGLHEVVRPQIKFVKSTERLGGREIRLPTSITNNDCSRSFLPSDSPDSSADSSGSLTRKRKSPSPGPSCTTAELIKGLTMYLPPPSPEHPFNPICCIYESCQRCNIHLEFIEEMTLRTYKCTLFIQSQQIATGYGDTKKTAKHDCASKAMIILMDKQTTLYKNELNHDNLKVVEKGSLVKQSYDNAAKLDDTNKGSQLLRKMGWKGSGGVGKYESGRADPVFLQAADGRQGVGTSANDGGIKRKTVEDRLLEFIRSEEMELKFSNELSNQERAVVHKLSQKYGLRHRSYGKGDARYLVVGKKV